jgi:hypothetical protein
MLTPAARNNQVLVPFFSLTTTSTLIPGPHFGPPLTAVSRFVGVVTPRKVAGSGSTDHRSSPFTTQTRSMATLLGNGCMSVGDTFTTTMSGCPSGGATGWKSRHAFAVRVYSWPSICTRSGAEAIEAFSELRHLHAVPHPVAITIATRASNQIGVARATASCVVRLALCVGCSLIRAILVAPASNASNPPRPYPGSTPRYGRCGLPPQSALDISLMTPNLHLP